MNMDFSESVVSAGRAVLDIVEREWQPLSPAELEQRLDQAVEDILEADLMAQLRTQPPPTIYLQLQQSQADVQPQVLQTTTTCSSQEEDETQDPGEPLQTSDSAAVQHIADLLQSSKSRTRMAGRACLSLPHTIMLSLTLLSERISYRTVSHRFHLEKGNIHRIFFSFCERINMLEETLITWPSGQEAGEALVPLCSPEKEQEEQDVPLVLGVLGHTCIPIRLPFGKRDVESTAPEVKRMKTEAHADSWINLELVCDHNGRFLNCRISKESDVDRGRALRDKLQQNPDLLPSGSCLVARSEYPLSAQILTPYSGSLGPREELFNKTLEGHFHILDQAVANLKARFQRLRYLDIGNYDRARAVVLTACVLHNVFLDMGQVVQGEVEKEESLSSEAEEEMDEEGVQRRDAISDLLFKNFDCVGT